jgi:SET domain-containing protein
MASSFYRIAPSRIHGQGLFTKQRIQRRMKLGELTGIKRRMSHALRDQLKREVMKLVELGQGWALDCTEGNEFSSLNHSCQANCYLRIAHRRVEIYSRGPIPAGHELTVDYGETMHEGGMACRCGLPGCRSRL